MGAGSDRGVHLACSLKGKDRHLGKRRGAAASVSRRKKGLGKNRCRLRRGSRYPGKREDYFDGHALLPQKEWASQEKTGGNRRGVNATRWKGGGHGAFIERTGTDSFLRLGERENMVVDVKRRQPSSSGVRPRKDDAACIASTKERKPAHDEERRRKHVNPMEENAINGKNGGQILLRATESEKRGRKKSAIIALQEGGSIERFGGACRESLFIPRREGL